MIATLTTAGLLALDKVVYTPLMTRWTEIESKTTDSSKELIAANKLIKESRQKNRDWAAMIGNRLPRDASTAESQILSSVRDWASESRLGLSSVKPERTEKEKDFYKITFRATANGNMSQVSRFLYHVQTSTVPARITDMTVTTRKEGTDELTLNVGIATIYPVPDSEKPKPAAAQQPLETASLSGARREVVR